MATNCKGCTDRHVGCHAHCEISAEFQKEQARIKQERNKHYCKNVYRIGENKHRAKHKDGHVLKCHKR